MKYENICLLLLSLKVIVFKSIIVVPFEMGKPNKKKKSNYTFEDFFSDNLLIDFYTTIYTGKENSFVLGRISTLDHIFTFSEEECNKKSLEQEFNHLILKTGYSLYKSKSYKNISKTSNYNLIISEIFSLYNTTYQSRIPPSLPPLDFIENLNLINSRITIDNMNIMLNINNSLINNKYCILIGLNNPYIKKDNQI